MLRLVWMVRSLCALRTGQEVQAKNLSFPQIYQGFGAGWIDALGKQQQPPLPGPLATYSLQSDATAYEFRWAAPGRGAKYYFVKLLGCFSCKVRCRIKSKFCKNGSGGPICSRVEAGGRLTKEHGESHDPEYGPKKEIFRLCLRLAAACLVHLWVPPFLVQT
jgi:hypothetical protein